MKSLPGVGGLSLVEGMEGIIDGLVWFTPPGTTARLQIDGDAESAPELLWSSRCAQVPATRAVILLDGQGFGDPTHDFEFAHGVAEDIAGLLSEEGPECGPIDVLVFRPDTDTEPWPRPGSTAEGAEFRFRHRGGADVHLTLTIPDQTGVA